VNLVLSVDVDSGADTVFGNIFIFGWVNFWSCLQITIFVRVRKCNGKATYSSLLLTVMKIIALARVSLMLTIRLAFHGH
jgi:hypothetical protein